MCLLPIIDPFHPRRNRSDDFVCNCTEFVSHFGDRQLFAKDDGGVALFGSDVGEVNHRDVHADIADDGSAFAVYKYFAYAVA